MDKSPIILELEKTFQILNDSLFEGKIKPVSFSVQIKKKTSLKWTSELNSIIIGGDILKLELKEIPGILLHEMIHIFNVQQQVVDVTTNQYHNKSFLQLALGVGFYVIKHKTQGWAITGTIFPRNVIQRDYIKRPTKEKRKLRNETFNSIQFDVSAFKLGQADIREKIKLEKPTKTFFLKYQCNCPPPHNSIRSGRRPDGPNALNIQCQNCRSQFECVTDLEPE
jgi:hypothetical protein